MVAAVESWTIQKAGHKLTHICAWLPYIPLCVVSKEQIIHTLIKVTALGKYFYFYFYYLYFVLLLKFMIKG